MWAQKNLSMNLECIDPLCVPEGMKKGTREKTVKILV